MIRSLVPLKIRFRPNSPDKYRPKNMDKNKLYEVVAEECRRRQADGKTVEDLLFGFIDDNDNLTFVASYNCFVGLLDVQYPWCKDIIM